MPPHAASLSGGLVENDDFRHDETKQKSTVGLQLGLADFKPVIHLGNGDMGNVYLVAERSSNVPYAMKVMRKDVLRAKKSGHRAQIEKEILAAVNHPFLPVLHSYFETDKHAFLVMNYCHGGDLNVLRQRQPERKFSESACRFYIAEMVLAIEYLHKRNIVYRDLKPENILVQESGHVMLTDFDLSLDLCERKWTSSASTEAKSPEKSKNSLSAKKGKTRSANKVKAFFPLGPANRVKMFLACGSPMVLAKKPAKKSPNSRVTPEELYSTSGRKTVSGKGPSIGPANSFVGTEEYVAPEILWGRGHGLPVDWWTLGILLHELYYGNTPFKGANRKETFFRILCKEIEFPGVRSPLTDLICKLLQKEPENRLGTKGGAEDVKKHPFFDGVNWDELQYISRTPVVPDPFSWEQIEKVKLAREKDKGKPRKSNWSFDKTTEPIEEARPMTESNQDRQAEDSEEHSIEAIPSEHNFAKNQSIVQTSDDAVINRQSDIDVHQQSTNPKEEVRLEDTEGLFVDVF